MNEKILILHQNQIFLDRISQNLRSSGFSTIIANNPESAIDFAHSLKPNLILWGDVLTLRNKTVIREFKNSESGKNCSVIALSKSAELFDRIDAEKFGVDDFFLESADYSELKSKIIFHSNISQRLQFLTERSQRFRNLSEINFNLMLSQDIVALCDQAADFLLKNYPVNFLIIAVYNSAIKDFDYLNLFSQEQKQKTDTEAMRLHPIWANYFFANGRIENEEVSSSEVLRSLKEWKLDTDKAFQYSMQYKDKNLGVLLISFQPNVEVDKEEETILATLAQAMAFRIQEIRKLFGTRREPTGETVIIRDYFQRLTEEEVLSYLSKQLSLLLQADLCLYMNYHEGFRFLYPKHLYIGGSEQNIFEEEKPPVLLLKDFTTFDKMLTTRDPLIINMRNDDDGKDIRELPGFKGRRFNNVVIFLLSISNAVQGFFVLSKESILKKYTRREIQDAEKLIQHATDALNDNRVMKQAQLTIKQLDRIFDLGKELTLDNSLKDILKKISSAIRRTLGWNVVILDKKNEFENSFENISVLGLKDSDYQKIIKQQKTYPPFKDRLVQSFSIGNSYFYDHLRTPEKDSENSLQEFASLIGAEWNDNDWIYIPIESRGKLLGMISLNDPVERRRPDANRIKSVEYFANQAAVVIENTELFESLKASELKYRMLAETMTMGLITCELSGKIIYVNQSLRSQLKYENDTQLLGKPIYELCTQNSSHKLEKEVIRVLKQAPELPNANESVAGLEVDMSARDGEEIPFMVYTSPYFHHKQRVGFFAVMSDLRSQKRIERLKSDFNSMIVHDLRSPLNIIQGYIDIVRTQLVGDISREQEELLAIAKENVYKILKLIDNFLIASKLEVGKFKIEPEVGSMNSLIEVVHEQHLILVKKKNITLAIDLDPNIPLLHFDKLRIEQVLTNFLSNALKFTPAEGKITIKDALKKRNNDLTGDVEMYVEVSVTDTGVGIRKSEMKKIFNKYEQTEAGKNAILKGTGLGLAICREIIELHNGEVWVESEEKNGSTFYFTLPINPLKI